jgi:hypothetical protein
MAFSISTFQGATVLRPLSCFYKVSFLTLDMESLSLPGQRGDCDFRN